jgi:hypothetical protein
LREILETALEPYWDDDIGDVIEATIEQSLDVGREAVQRQIALHSEQLDEARDLYRQAFHAVMNLRNFLEPIVKEITAAIELPELDIPTASPQGDVDRPLFSSADEWPEQTRRLIEERL